MASSAAIPDPEELGITILYEGKPSTVDIICVHGLNSNPNQCWRKGDVLWLRDLLPGETELKNTRIATFGYNSKILDEASRARVTDHATKLLLRLLAVRKDEEAKERPIIFVCHSLGGIVVKQALVIAQQTPRYRNIQMSTTGIVFLGTPHQGSKLASFGQTMAKVAKVAFKNPKTHLLKTLEKNSEELLDLSVQFSNLHDQFRIVSCFETRDTILSKGLFQKTEMVVPESSAKLAIQEEILVAMDTDHRNICKFSGVKDPGYIDVKDMIVELVGRAPSVAKERFKPAVGLSLNAVSLSHISLTPDLPPQTKTLFGRETELESLHTYFTSPREVRKVAVLWGLGGMGKSQLALKYQEQHQPPYTSVFWVNSQTEEDIVISFQKIVSSLLCAICQLFPEISEQHIAQSLGIRNVGVLTEALRTTKDAHMVINSLKGFLSKKDNRNWLLVFDSWDSSDNVDLRLLFPPNIYGDIVVTTRQKDYENLGLSQEVTGIGIGAATELLMNRTLQGTSQEPGMEKDQDLQDAEKLASELGGVPLALEQAETYMFSTQTRIHEYLILLKKNSEKILGHRPTEFEWAYDKNEPVFQTLEITFSALSTYPDACNLLSFLAFLNPSHITQEVFNKFMSGEIFLQPLSNQVGQSLEAIQILFTDESRFGQAKSTLVRFCLISSKVLSTQGPWKIDIHPLVHQWSRLRLGIEKQQELSISVAFSLAVMVRIKGKSTPTHLLLAQRLSPHIDFSLGQLYSRKVFDETSTPSKPWFEVIQFTIENFASFYWKGKRHDEAAQLYQLILGGLNLCEDTSEDGMIRLSNTSESLGRVLWESGELVRAEDFVKRAVDVKAEIFGWESESVVETANLLKKIQERRSHIAMMEEHSRNAVSLPKALLGRDQPGEHYHEEMPDEEWVLYSSIVESIELGCDDSEILMVIQDLAVYRRRMPVENLSVLQAAISQKLNDVVKLLIDRGADINVSGGYYGTALQAAAFFKNELIVQLLIDRGADINASGGHFGTTLQAAACCGNKSIVQLLIDRGADINATGGYFGTALQAAACCGNEPIVQLLIDRGADINAIRGNFGTALQAAACCGNEPIVQLLIDRGADTNASGGKYGTALQAAACYGNVSIVQLLIDRGADIIDLTTLAAVKKLADKFSKEGHWKKAEYLHSQVVNGYKKFSGDDHPNTLSQIEKLSTAVLMLRKLEESEALVVQVLRGRGVSSGGNSQSTLKALENLSWTYFKQRRLKEAEELELRVLELLPEDHPDVSSVMANLALIHSKGNRWEEGLLGGMVPQYLRNLRKTKLITSEFHQDPEPREDETPPRSKPRSNSI